MACAVQQCALLKPRMNEWLEQEAIYAMHAGPHNAAMLLPVVLALAFHCSGRSCAVSCLIIAARVQPLQALSPQYMVQMRLARKALATLVLHEHPRATAATVRDALSIRLRMLHILSRVQDHTVQRLLAVHLPACLQVQRPAGWLRACRSAPASLVCLACDGRLQPEPAAFGLRIPIPSKQTAVLEPPALLCRHLHTCFSATPCTPAASSSSPHKNISLLSSLLSSTEVACPACTPDDLPA